MGRPRKRRRGTEDDDDSGQSYNISDPVPTIIHPAPPPINPVYATQWDSQWIQMCNQAETRTLIGEEFQWLNDEYTNWRSVESRAEYMSDIHRNLANPPRLPTPEPLGGPPPVPILPTCTCAFDLFSSISTLQMTPATSNIQHCILISKGVISSARSTLACDSCLSTMTTAYSSLMLLSITLPLLVLFFRKTVECVEKVDPSFKPVVLQAIRREFVEINDIIAILSNLSKRKDGFDIEGAHCKKMLADGSFVDAPICKKVLGTVKMVAQELERAVGEVGKA
ncbi:hypothetical protein BZA77DRAFT_374334 [Pyronema omphalodes]|nr:hypothetical protein BZA77DRAFT_374334 [Pyronema omphalodes]